MLGGARAAGRDGTGSATPRPPTSGSCAAAPCTSSCTSWSSAEPLRVAAARRSTEGRPVALATLLDGDRARARRSPCSRTRSSARSASPQLLDDNVARDARGFLDEGRSSVRGYSAQGRDDGRRHPRLRSRRSPRRRAWSSSARSTSPPRSRRWRPRSATASTIVDARAAFASAPALLAPRRGRRRLARRLPADARRSARATRCSCSPTTRSSTSRRCCRRCETGAGFIGALGSRRTHDERTERLRAAGATDDDLARISSPVRPRRRRAHPGRDRDRRPRRDPRAALAPLRRPPVRGRRPDPPAPAEVT